MSATRHRRPPKLKFAIYRKPLVTVDERGKWKDVFQEIPVRVMATAEGWALCRRSDVRGGAAPFAVQSKSLLPVPRDSDQGSRPATAVLGDSHGESPASPNPSPEAPQ